MLLVVNINSHNFFLPFMLGAAVVESYEDLWQFSARSLLPVDLDSLLTALQALATTVSCQERYRYVLCQTPAILGNYHRYVLCQTPAILGN